MTHILSDIYLGLGDSTVHVVGRKTQVSEVFSHLDGETVRAGCLVVQFLWIPGKKKWEFSPQQVKNKQLIRSGLNIKQS